VVLRVVVALALELALELVLESAVCVGWAEMHLFFCVSRVSADSLRCHFGKEGIRARGFDEE
jgi:hypothetical protein